MTRHISTIAATFALLLAAPISAQNTPPPALNLEQKTALRCAAAFALVAYGQKNGNADAMAYPSLGERGREFFVRSSAKLMDETGLDRAALADMLQKQALTLRDEGKVDQIMPSCLLLLEASGV